MHDHKRTCETRRRSRTKVYHTSDDSEPGVDCGAIEIDKKAQVKENSTMSLRLTPAPQALPANKPPSPVRPNTPMAPEALVA